MQARFEVDQVHPEGRFSEYVRISDEGEEGVFCFRPECGATVFSKRPSAPELVAVPVGAFADPTFPAPTWSVWEERQHSWVALPEAIEYHLD